MAFQKTVNRQYTQGWVGEILNDGPTRARPGLIAAVAGAVNRVGRAFTVVGDVDPGKPSGTGGTPAVSSTTISFIEQTVQVGGTGSFFGILGSPKHYALYGTTTPAAGEQAGPLSPTMDLPANSEGEFFDMAIMALQIANGSTDGTAAPAINDPVYYCVSAAANANFYTTTAADLGRLFVFKAGATVPNNFKAVPNAKITTIPGTLPASTTTAATDYTVRVQLTN